MYGFEKIKKLSQKDIENYAEADQTTITTANVLFQVILEIDMKDEKVKIIKSDKYNKYMEQRVPYTYFLSNFVDRLMDQEERDEFEEHFSIRAIQKFQKNDLEKDIRIIRMKDDTGAIMWYQMVLVKSMTYENRVLLMIREDNEYYQNLVLKRSTEDIYDLLLGIQVSNGRFIVFSDKNGKFMTECFINMDYDTQVITHCYHYVSAKKIDQTIRRMSLQRIIERLERHDEYVAYTMVDANGVIEYKKYRYVYLNEKKEMIIAARMDVTEEIIEERKRNKKLRDALLEVENASKEKDEFLSKVSHDMRTPMSTIMGMSMLAASHIEERECVLKSLDNILISGKHLLSLIDNILDLKRIDRGVFSLQKDNFSMKKLIQNMKNMIDSQIKEHHHQFHIEQNLEQDYLYGDGNRIFQVLINLVTNAIKYTPDGGEIYFKIREFLEKDGRRVTYIVQVKDNGIGMSKQFLEHIFEPFAREKDTRVNEVLGMGLGMTIVKNILDMMSGDIKIHSQINSGTEFLVYFNVEICKNKLNKKTDSSIEIF